MKAAVNIKKVRDPNPEALCINLMREKLIKHAGTSQERAWAESIPWQLVSHDNVMATLTCGYRGLEEQVGKLQKANKELYADCVYLTEKNMFLKTENQSLRTENKDLQAENDRLRTEKNRLCSEIETTHAIHERLYRQSRGVNRD